MKPDQLIDYNKQNIFYTFLGMETSSTPLSVLKKALYDELKASGLQLSFNIFQ